MKNLNRSSYSKQELKEIKESLPTAWSTAVLSRRYAKKFKRSTSGVYNKIRQMREELNAIEPAIITQPVQAELNLQEPIREININRVEIFSDHIKLYINN